MTLMRLPRTDLWNWAPTTQWTNLRDEINRLFDAPFGDFARTSELFSGWAPTLDLYEDKENLVVKAELPGLKKEDIEISFQNGTLAVSGERKSEEKLKDAETYRSERFFGRFHRTLSLPKPVHAEKIKAAYKDGILTVTLPKTEEAKPKQIEVH